MTGLTKKQQQRLMAQVARQEARLRATYERIWQTDNGTGIVTGPGGSATGERSISWGIDSIADGFESQAYGIRNIARGRHAATIGRDNISNGNISGTIGSINEAHGTAVFALGAANQVGDSDNTVQGSFVIGINNNVQNSDVHCYGGNNVVTGNSGSTVIGRVNNIGGGDAFVVGNQNTSSGEHSTIFGVLNDVGNASHTNINGNTNKLVDGTSHCVVNGNGNTIDRRGGISSFNTFIMGNSNYIRSHSVTAVSVSSKIYTPGVYIGTVTDDSESSGTHISVSPGAVYSTQIRRNVETGTVIGANADVGSTTNSAKAYYPVALGAFSHAIGNLSVAIGPFATADSDGEIRIGGRYHDAFSGQIPFGRDVDPFVTVSPITAGTETRDHQLVSKKYVDIQGSATISSTSSALDSDFPTAHVGFMTYNVSNNKVYVRDLDSWRSIDTTAV